ncbi:MAG: class B sortase [Erysipelotrichales bacterium]|nr:class B sortase [Erysipelotrichales bacterium]
MNYNIDFKISTNTLIVSKVKKDVDYKSLNNTNIIDIKDLKFSKPYIEENFELVSNFINLVILKGNITKLQINNFEIASTVLKLINECSYIKTIIFKPDKTINLDIFLLLSDNNYIEEIECFEIPAYLVERLDMNKNIKVKIRNNINTSSKFMIINELMSYSDIYYKKYIVISHEFDSKDLEEFKMFMNLNSKLRVIKIVSYSNEILTTIVNEIIENKKGNITIETNEKNNDLNSIYNSVNYLKKTYHKYFEENNIRFRLNYSKEYKRVNFIKQINFKMFTSIILFIIILSSLIVVINSYQQYKDQNKIESELIDIESILKESEEYLDIDDSESDVDYIDIDSETTTKKKSNYISSYYTNFDQVFENLLKINNDTVGWVQVNNTKINYPVVQAETNSYYLNRDYYKKKNSMGWIFMDYRNDPENLDRNTIIYGHNIKQGIMFGTIKNMMNKNWYNNTSNQIITFNTQTKNMKWQIFSLYQINETEDYLKNEFVSDEEYMNFLNMLVARSKKNFNVPLNANSKILTLSTCFSHTTRHVVHAVLIEDTEEEITNKKNS